MDYDYQKIYATQAEQYDILVQHEDYAGQLLPALQAIRPLAGLDVVEFGAGTGRVTLLLAPRVCSIHAFDQAPAMLHVARRKLQQSGLTNWRLGLAENRALPVAAASADLTIEGWSFAHAVGWYPQSWRQIIGKSLAEMMRILRPDGTMILIETLGTGQKTPAPAPKLAEFYHWLETEYHFESSWIRTDYQFPSVGEAADSIRFFFGDELADQLRRDQNQTLPECTGIWWRTL